MKRKHIIYVLAIVFSAGVFASVGYGMGPSRYIDYKIRNNQYAVIYVNKNNSSEEVMRELAMKQAARIAEKNGYQYFKVDKEEDVYVSEARQNEDMPRNLYQEVIIDRNFNREVFVSDRQYPENAGVYPGYKLVISLYKDEPSGSFEDVGDY